jgi:hypothetical protein
MVTLCANTALAQPTKSAVNAVETVCYIVEPGTQWVTGDGILHIRGQVRKDRVVPENEPRVDGWAYLFANLDLDTNTGDGTFSGMLIVQPIAPSLSAGLFQGRFTGKITAGSAVGKAEAQGQGIFDGLKLSGTFADFPSDPATAPCPDDAVRPFLDHRTQVTGMIFQAHSK